MFMKKPNLRFLLALGSQKVVVMQQEDQMHIYGSKAARNVSVERISQAVLSK